MSKRKEAWQLLRGVCIIAVVACHVPGFFSIDDGATNYYFYLLIRQLVSFCVPVFLFISGFFSGGYYNSTYLNNRFKKLIIPYVEWTTIYVLLNCFMSFRSGARINAKEILYDYLLGRATAPLYYIIVLLQFVLITPLLAKIVKENGILSKVLWLITPGYLVIMYGFILLNGAFPKNYNVWIFGWFSFYYLGLYCRIQPNNINNTVKRIGHPSIIIIAFLSCVFEAIIATELELNPSYIMNQMKISSMLFSFTLCIYSYKIIEILGKTEVPTFLGVFKWIGDNSYGVFYAHELVKVFVVAFCSRIINAGPILFVTEWIVCVLMSALFVDLSRLICKKLKLSSPLFTAWL